MWLAEIIVGLLALAIGAMFAFQGSTLMRILFPFVGFFTGFSLGAGMVAGMTNSGFLSTLFGWVVGFFVALLFAVLAYFFYAFAVVLAFAGLGFSIAAGLLTLLHLDWNWLIVIVGTAVALVFGLVAVMSRMPIVVLVVITAFFGAAIGIYGLMLIFNTATFGDFSNGTVISTIQSRPGLYILWLGLGIWGSLVQIRILGEQTKLAQKYWESSPTFEELMAASK